MNEEKSKYNSIIKSSLLQTEVLLFTYYLLLITCENITPVARSKIGRDIAHPS